MQKHCLPTFLLFKTSIVCSSHHVHFKIIISCCPLMILSVILLKAKCQSISVSLQITADLDGLQEIKESCFSATNQLCRSQQPKQISSSKQFQNTNRDVYDHYDSPLFLYHQRCPGVQISPGWGWGYFCGWESIPDIQTHPESQTPNLALWGRDRKVEKQKQFIFYLHTHHTIILL